MDDPLFEYDNHQIHVGVHRQFILSAEFTQLSQDLQMIALSHLGAHSDIAKAQQQEQMAMAMAERVEAKSNRNRIYLNQR